MAFDEAKKMANGGRITDKSSVRRNIINRSKPSNIKRKGTSSTSYKENTIEFVSEFLKYEKEGWLDYFNSGHKTKGKLIFLMYDDSNVTDDVNEETNEHIEIYHDNVTGLKIKVMNKPSCDAEIEIIDWPNITQNEFGKDIITWEESDEYPDPKDFLVDLTDMAKMAYIEGNDSTFDDEKPFDGNKETINEVFTTINTSHIEGIVDQFIEQSINDPEEKEYYESLKDKIDPDTVIWTFNCHVGTDKDKTYTLVTKEQNEPVFISKDLIYKRSFRLKKNMLGLKLYYGRSKYFLYHIPNSKDYWLEIIKENDKEPCDIPDNFILYESNMSLIMDLLDERNITKEFTE